MSLHLAEVTIESQSNRKGRSFCALHLASVVANRLWAGGGGGKDEVRRPVYASFAGSESELRPFVANLQLGRLALVGEKRHRHSKAGFEFLKSAGYKFFWQRESEGAIATAFLPELFLLDPGMVDPKAVHFVCLPSRVWAAKQEIDAGPIVAHASHLPFVQKLNAPPDESDWRVRRGDYVHAPVLSEEKLASMVSTAYLFAAYLDRRTRAPILADGRFYMQILLACLRDKLASWSSDDRRGGYYGRDEFGLGANFGFLEESTAQVGFLPGVALSASHEEIEALLAAEVAVFFEMTS